MRSQQLEAPNEPLTLRETEVLAHLVKLASNQAIALELGCSVKTVEFHVSNILRKTKTASRMELVVKVLNSNPTEHDNRR